ncbi:MAG: ABC transporter permease, partial [Flavobacteriales bacterium]
IYRLVQKNTNSNTIKRSVLPKPLGALLKETMPEVEDYTRILSDRVMKLAFDDISLKDNVSYIDASFFNLFDFSLKLGSVTQFDNTPNGLIISEKIAENFFKGENPIGKIITVNEEYNTEKTELQIVGVLNEIPETSTIQGDYFINFKNIDTSPNTDGNNEAWVTTAGGALYLYAPKLKNGLSFSKKAGNQLYQKMNSSYRIVLGEEMNFNAYYSLDLQRLDTIYFDSTDIIDQKRKGDLQFLYIIILVGLLTLFLATSNYIIMNLGLNLNRAKEFKLKRYLGASKANIYTQLIIESLLNAGICFVITLLSYPILGKFISDLIGFDYQLSLIDDSLLLITYFSIILLIGFITGSLEYLLSYKTIFINDDKEGNNKPNSWFSKKVMIVFQLFIFIGLAICILFLGKQVNFMQTKDLGFDTENAVSFSTLNHKSLKSFLDSKSYIKATSYSDNPFTPILNLAKLNNAKTNETIETTSMYGDSEFLEVYGMELMYGENFAYVNPETKEPSKRPESGFGKTVFDVLVNEEFVRKSNLENPIGEIYKSDNSEYVIKGVFKNIYNLPMYYPIQPLMVLERDFDGWYYGSLSASFVNGNKKQLESDLKTFFVEKGKDLLLLDDIIWDYDYNDIYKKELQLKRLLEAFTVIVLFISLLGIVAISLFITESKTKEIGIRKVNGATINEIMLMLNKDFVKWVLFAFIIAVPITYYIMSKWLENFAYKTSLSWWVFALAGAFTLVISLLTVSWQTYKAASKHPVESLRDE